MKRSQIKRRPLADSVLRTLEPEDKLYRELETLKTLVEIDHLDRPLQDVQDRITELEDSLARNPVRKLVDAGLMQTIVEDVENQEDRFSYKSRLARWTDSKTQWMPEVMKKAGKFAVVSHDTELYKVLYSTTHMSDFVARYALYEHVTNNGKDFMDHAEAIQYVEDAFVNYDVPTHKFIQYLNDMGLVMFTKYYLRIQKVLFRLYRENPARALALVLFANVMDMIPTIVESGFWNRLSNPLRGGATEFVDAIDEALPINTALRFVQ